MPRTQDWIGGSLGFAGGLGYGLHQLLRERRADQLAEMKLRADHGTFTPVPAGEQPDRSFFERLFGGGLPEDTYDLGGGRLYRLEPYPELGEEGARAFGLTTPMTTPYAPRQPLPLDDTPAGPLFATGLPTPSTATTETVSPAIARLRLSPKTTEALTLEQLKDHARARRDQAVEASRTARARLVAEARNKAALERQRDRAEGIRPQPQTPQRPPSPGSQSAAPSPRTSAGPGSASDQPTPAPAPPAPAAQQTPQAAAVIQRYVRFYEAMSDEDLAKETRRLQRPAPMDSLAPYRQRALEAVRAARTTAPVTTS